MEREDRTMKEREAMQIGRESIKKDCLAREEK